MVKMLFKIALAIMLILVLPLALAILGAIWPVSIAAFLLLFPLVAIGAIIGYRSGKKK